MLSSAGLISVLTLAKQFNHVHVLERQTLPLGMNTNFLITSGPPCRRAGVPHLVVGGTNFWEREEVKDILAWLRLANKASDTAAIERIYDKPTRGLGAKGMEALREAASQQGMSLASYMFQGCEDVGALAKQASKFSVVSWFLFCIACDDNCHEEAV